MKTCPNCGAPNPGRLLICFSCGDNLDGAPADPNSLAGAAFHCSNCRARLADGAEVCANCGRVAESRPVLAVSQALSIQTNAPAGRSEYAPEIPILRGWTAERLADGSTRLRRDIWQRVNSDIPLPIVCAFLGLILLYPDGRYLPGSGVAVDLPGRISVSCALGCIFALVSVCLALWQFGAVEDIRMGSGFFVRTKALGPIVRHDRFDVVADIQGQTREGRDRSGGYTTRSLAIANLGRKLTLYKRVLGRGFMGLGSELPSSDDDIAQLGRFIAATTGWRFTDNV